MTLAEQLKAETVRRKLATKELTRVFSVFNIGTDHGRDEVNNNTFAALGNACVDRYQANAAPRGTGVTMGAHRPARTTHTNNGPGKKDTNVASTIDLLGSSQGWGMNDLVAQTVAAIKHANPTHVNMTGHSRGGILCHMLAHAMHKDEDTRHITVSMIVLDPVHMSALSHPGAEVLSNPNVLTYHAIIMQNEDQSKGPVPTAFPFKFVEASAATERRMHYIPMPGKHGSGSQHRTSAIGNVVFHLIANFMRARGTKFDPKAVPVPTPLDMCEYFARIHLENPVSIKDARRVIFDDPGTATQHDPNKWTLHSAKKRAKDIALALEKNLKSAPRPGQKVLPKLPTLPPRIDPYFFNQEHAFYFKAAFPTFFRVLAAAPQKTDIRAAKYEADVDRMDQRPALRETFAMLATELMPLLK